MAEETIHRISRAPRPLGGTLEPIAEIEGCRAVGVAGRAPDPTA